MGGAGEDGSCGGAEWVARWAAREAEGGDVSQEGELSSAMSAGEGFLRGELRERFVKLAKQSA